MYPIKKCNRSRLRMMLATILNAIKVHVYQIGI